MNAPNQWYQDEDQDEIDYSVHMRQTTNSPEMKTKRRAVARTKARPSSTNTAGIHRRHNKRWSW